MNGLEFQSIYILALVNNGLFFPLQFLYTVKVFLFFDAFVVSTKCIDLWVIELVSSTTGSNSQWENCILLKINFRSLSEP